MRYKWVVLLFLILGGTGAWFYADWVTPVYQSKGTLLISSENASTNDELSQIITQTTGYGTSSTLENELQVLRSRKFSLQIAQKIMDLNPDEQADYPVLWRELEDGDSVKLSKEGVAANIRNNLSFNKPEAKSDVVDVRFKSTSPNEAARVVNLVMETYVESSTRQNRQAAAETAEFLEKEKEELKQKLEESERTLRRYMDNTGMVKVDQQASTIVQNRADFDAQLQQATLEMQTIDQAIGNYEEQLEIIKPGLSEQFVDAIGPRIEKKQEELAQYEHERTLIIAKNPGITERSNLPSRLKYLNDQIERLESEIKDLSKQLFTNTDEYMGFTGQDRAQKVAEIQAKLVDLRISKNQTRSQIEALRQHKSEMDSAFNSLPSGMIRLAKLKRDVKINEELYLNVSRQYADMSVWKQSQYGFGRIIDSGVVPSTPVSPNKKILLLLGLMLGGFLSALFIATREFMDNSVKNVDYLRTFYLPSHSFSVVPTIEKVSRKKRKTFKTGNGKIPVEMVLLQDRSSVVSEAIRRLKNNIIYQNGEIPPRTLAVTSPEKGDGKSTIVANLGLAFAEEGYKTLVIDTDFRRPRLHKYFGLPEQAGLYNYLNDGIPVQKLIQNSELNTLKIISAGYAIDKPETVGNSSAMKQLLKKLEGVFDIIILDTPPFGIISDSAALLKWAENTVIVARYRTTNREMLFRTIDELERIHANVTNIVMNDFDYRKETGHYYGTGYYHTMYSGYHDYAGKAN